MAGIMMNDAMLAMLQTPEIIGLLVLALIFFGAKKLPELARGLGSGIKEFKKATRDVTDELQNAIESEPAPPRRTIPPPESQPMSTGAESLETSEVETASASSAASVEKPGS
jgi:sec-independent protein translocase protein TatA